MVSGMATGVQFHEGSVSGRAELIVNVERYAENITVDFVAHLVRAWLK